MVFWRDFTILHYCFRLLPLLPLKSGNGAGKAIQAPFDFLDLPRTSHAKKQLVGRTAARQVGCGHYFPDGQSLVRALQCNQKRSTFARLMYIGSLSKDGPAAGLTGGVDRGVDI